MTGKRTYALEPTDAETGVLAGTFRFPSSVFS